MSKPPSLHPPVISQFVACRGLFRPQRKNPAGGKAGFLARRLASGGWLPSHCCNDRPVIWFQHSGQSNIIFADADRRVHQPSAFTAIAATHRQEETIAAS